MKKSNEDMAMFLMACSLILVSSFVSSVFTNEYTNHSWEVFLVDYGVAEYNSQTGDWKMKDQAEQSGEQK